MLVVIFRAKIRRPDRQYLQTASRLRELAIAEFGCLAFDAVTEGEQEVALSWWPSEAHIEAWRAHPEHVAAQRRGRSDWYQEYSVQVANVLREYRSSTLP